MSQTKVAPGTGSGYTAVTVEMVGQQSLLGGSNAAFTASMARVRGVSRYLRQGCFVPPADYPQQLAERDELLRIEWTRTCWTD